ncbi:SPX domain-containing protein [Tieghemostelium lacteum]|uniref:SPX domain-containing protein n=1 Tax=Tieghemostelium lacteum TaxID=361077 RepID=A0A151Z5Q5_TIELA|nr:SPX domain-containing protein [Tieghemostelium lacteum]|eukprot:KYQ89267.1 SPX domain-containing protein [Tieghemostelium lacteum]
MKFREYLEANIINHWRDRYLDYEYLKSLLNTEIVNVPPPPSLNHSTVDIHAPSKSQSIRSVNSKKLLKHLPIDNLLDEHKNILSSPSNSDLYDLERNSVSTPKSPRLLLNTPIQQPRHSNRNIPTSPTSHSISPPLQANHHQHHSRQTSATHDVGSVSSMSSILTNSNGHISTNQQQQLQQQQQHVKTPLLSETSEDIEMDTLDISNEVQETPPHEQDKFSFSIPIEKFFKDQKNHVHHSSEDEQFYKVYLSQIEKVNTFFTDRYKKFKSKSIELCNMIPFLNDNKHLRNQRNVNYLKKGFQDNFKFLTMLESYRQLNVLGFKKIMGKYEIIQYNTISQDCKRQLLNSNISRYEQQMEHLIQQIKNIYSRYFTGNDLKLANADLKGTSNGETKKSDRWIGFVIGILIGLCIVLGSIVIYNYIFYYPHNDPPIDSPLAWLLFRISLLPILLGLLFSLMTFIWNLSGINFVFIFEFKPDISRSPLKYFRVGMIFIFFWLCCLFFYIDTAGKKNNIIPPIAFPIIFISVSILIAILPFPILQPGTRFWILKRIGRVVSAPFVPVRFADFFMSVQLLSLGEFLFNIQSMICVFNRSTLHPDEIHFCSQSAFFAFPILNALPYYWRVMQCFRRYYETRRFFPHITSAIRSIFSIVSLILSYVALRYSTENWSSLKAIWFCINIIGSFYKWYADLAVDWGFLLNRKSNPAWPLREKLVFKKKFIYYLAIVIDLLLRFLWLLVFLIRVSSSSHRLDNPVFLFFFSLGEVFWASQFIFFRVESEHCLSADHYNTFQDIPMPFSEEYTQYMESLETKHKAKQQNSQQGLTLGSSIKNSTNSLTNSTTLPISPNTTNIDNTVVNQQQQSPKP